MFIYSLFLSTKKLLKKCTAEWQDDRIGSSRHSTPHGDTNLTIYRTDCPCENFRNQLRNYSTPGKSKAKKRFIRVGRKTHCTYPLYLIPLLAQHSMVWSREIPNLWLLLQVEKKGEICIRCPDFWGYCPRDWFLSQLTLGRLKEKQQHTWVPGGLLRSKSSPVACHSTREIIVTQTDTRGSTNTLTWYSTTDCSTTYRHQGELLSRNRQTSLAGKLHT